MEKTNTDDPSAMVLNDDEMMKIISRIEEKTGKPYDFSKATPAVTFGEDPDEKIYLVLLVINKDVSSESETDDKIADWVVVRGRQNTYNYLKLQVQTDAIDMDVSYVLSGSTAPEKAITVRRFLLEMLRGHKVIDYGSEALDIDDTPIESDTPITSFIIGDIFVDETEGE